MFLREITCQLLLLRVSGAKDLVDTFGRLCVITPNHKKKIPTTHIYVVSMSLI